jgi:hypothetical protein
MKVVALRVELLIIVLVLATISVSALLYRLFTNPSPNAGDVTAILDAVNLRPVPPTAYRVLFIGDSLMMVVPAHRLWDHFSGMAASAADRDFVHLVAKHIQSRLGSRPVEIFYDNGGNGKIGPMLDYLRNRPDMRPDIVILQGGENDKFDAHFQSTYEGLLHYSSPKTPVIVLGDWWSTDKSVFEQKEAASLGYSFVNLTAIYAEPSNSGYAGPYNVKGVARHPNDKGMQSIANAICIQYDNVATSNSKVAQ